MILYFLAAFSFISLTWLAYKKPHLALYSIVALMPSYLLRLNILGFPSTILEILILGTSLGILLHNFKKENWLKTKKRIIELYKKEKYWLILLAIILISSIIAIIISPDKLKALGLAKAYIWEAMWIFILFLLYWQKENIEKAILFLIPTTILVNLLNLYQFIKAEGIIEFDGFSHNMRVTGPYNYPNAVGLFLAPITILFIYLVFKYFKEKKYLLTIFPILLILGNLFSIYQAQSEAALLAIAAAVFLLSLNFKYLRSLAIIAAIGITLFAYQANYLEKIWEKLTLQDFSGTIRQHIYMESSEMLRNNFLLGAGLAGYQKSLENYHLDVLIMEREDGSLFEQPVEIYLYPHNIILNFWTELGFFAMLSFLFIFIYYTIKNYYIFLKEKKLINLFLSLTLITILIHGLFDVPYFKNDLAILFWFIIAASILTETTTINKN